jgi:hypothetical protein
LVFGESSVSMPKEHQLGFEEYGVFVG